MRKFGKFLGAALCGLIIGAGAFGTVNASAAELPKLDFKPKALNVEYGDNSDIASKLNVMIPGNSKLIELGEANEAYVYTQVDWKFSEKDDWKYDAGWDKLVRKNEGSSWEFIDLGVEYEYDDSDSYYTFDMFCFDKAEDYDWSGEYGWSNVVPASYLKNITIKGEKCNTIDWNKVGVDIRYRNIIIRTEYDEVLDEDVTKSEASEWSDVVSFGNFAKDYEGIDNLLVNPDFEDGLDGWKDPDKVWSAVYNSDTGEPKHGNFLVWPYLGAGLEKKTTRIYQDVSLENFKTDDTVIFNALICNYDQPPHDMGKVTLVFYDKDDKVINSYAQSQRNPNWNSQSLICSIPEGAKKVRVNLWAYRYVGSDIDAYYDYCSLVVKPIKVYPVVVTEKNNKSKVKAGDKLQLTADNSKTKDAGAYTWSSSYNTAATVDANGLVTMHTDAEDGVAIYAKDNESGVTGVYWLNSSEEQNASSVVDNSVITDDGVKKPAGAAVKKLTAAKKALTVTWKKVAGVKGYEIRYSLKKNMASSKTVDIKKASTVKKKISKLKAKKTYYVQIRTYVMNGKTKVYSDWSAAKSIKVK
ncbi:MAG: Ig-like domain-containing protein [Lachnospiraceae bacterium]|nr:Ig-like domain-containing protein [Lachnospiraceae bacterium]